MASTGSAGPAPTRRPGTRHTGRRRLATAAVLVLAALGTVPAAGSPATATAAPTPAAPGTTEGEGRFTVGVLKDVDSLNPFTGIAAQTYEVWGTMYDTLTGYSTKDYSATPRLAQSWTTSADGKTWTFTIRSGVTWSDGVPLTAKDVAYTFNRIMKGSYERTNYGSYVAKIASVTAPDDTTVVMKTTAPTPIMTRLAVPILPEHVWSKVSEQQVMSYADQTDVVGSGPFQLVERKNGQFVRLRANKSYWDGAPKIDELVFRVYRNADALGQALKRGEVDFADALDADVWQSLKNTPGLVTDAVPSYSFGELAFNTGAALADGTPIGDGHPALKDTSVRVALSYAVDRKALVDRILDGHGTPGSTIIPPAYTTLHLEPANPDAFDLAKADQLLDQAGYARGADGARTMPGSGRPLTLRLFARQESQPSQQAAKLIQGWFEEVGVVTDITVVAEDDLTEIVGRGTFDMFLWGWVVEPDPDYQLSTFTCANRSYEAGGDVFASLSDSFYCNKEYDALYAKQANQIDPVQRARTVKQMQQILYDDAPYVLTWYDDDTRAYSDRWTGFGARSESGALPFQYGAYTYRTIERKQATTAVPDAPGTTSTADPGAGTIVGLGAAVVLLLAGGGVLLARRRRADADHE